MATGTNLERHSFFSSAVGTLEVASLLARLASLLVGGGGGASLLAGGGSLGARAKRCRTAEREERKQQRDRCTRAAPHALSLYLPRAPDCSVGAPLSLSLCAYCALHAAASARASHFWRAPDRVPPRYGPLATGQERAKIEGTHACRGARQECARVDDSGCMRQE